MSELDELLDVTLDDLDDLPSFEPYPSGAHRVTASFELKDINGKPAAELKFTLLETLELADPQATAPKPGDTCNTMFMLRNEFGLGNFKKTSAPFAEALGLTSIRDILEGVKEVECVIITGIRVDKNDTSKRYLQVKELSLV